MDRVVRFGGEEFALIVMESDGAAALEAAQRACAAIGGNPIVASESLNLPITMSAGVACMPEDADSADQLVAAADKALYAAKTAGRNGAHRVRNV